MATQYWYPLTRFEWHGKAFVASLQASQAPLAEKNVVFAVVRAIKDVSIFGDQKHPTKKGTIYIIINCCCWFLVVIFPFRFLRCHGTRMGSGTQFTVDRFVDSTPFPDFCFGTKMVEE